MPSLLSLSVEEFLAEAASDAPAPGGGAVAALAGSLGAAMAAMAANFTLRPKFAEHEERIREILAELAPLAASLKAAVDADAAAFTAISRAYALPKASAPEKAARAEAVRSALTEAMRVPARVAADCRAASRLLAGLAKIGNPNLLSDVNVAAIMLAAAAAAARVNVSVNARQLGPEAAQTQRQAEAAEAEAAALAGEAANIIRARTGGL